MNPLEVLLLAFLIGVIAGLRTMTAPAVAATTCVTVSAACTAVSLTEVAMLPTRALAP